MIQLKNYQKKEIDLNNCRGNEKGTISRNNFSGEIYGNKLLKEEFKGKN